MMFHFCPSHNRHKPVLLLLAATMLIISACGDESPPAANQSQAGGPPGPGGPAGRGDRTPTPVEVTEAATGSIASHYEATATLEAEKQAEILARVQGVVGSLSCEEGDQVVAGQRLLSIDNNEYNLRLEQAAARTANLKARHDRLLRMLEENLTSEEEYETARSDLDAAEADEGLAQLNVDYTSVDAPFAGRIVQRLVDTGQNINVATPLFLLADFNPLLARIHVPARELRDLRVGQSVALTLDSDGTAVQGVISLISPVIDATSGTVKITVEIDRYPANTRPGDFAEVRIITEQRDSAILVPTGAVFTDKGQTVAYVAVDGPGGLTAEQRIVETGFRDLLNIQIISGIEPGESVVIKGQRSLKPKVPLKILTGDGAPADSSSTTPAPVSRPGGGRGHGGGGGGGHGGGHG